MTVAQQTLSEIELDVEERIDLLWQYVRERRHSLDADGARRKIREAIKAANEAVISKIEPMFDENEKLKEEVASLKSELRKKR